MTCEKSKKLKWLDEDSPKWQKLAVDVAFDYAPQINSCETCGRPKAKGYKCLFCDDDPKNVEKENGRSEESSKS